ncbi:MAG: DUF2147 domain-containing protein [Pirellulales bacterium]|nr:DUF2147 domain-containing protein [Pirellulales bacterium]
MTTARWLLLFLLASVLLPAGAVLAADKEDPAKAVLGKWWFPKRNGKMEIYRDGDKFFGKVIAYDEEGALDKNNPDPELAKRPFVGITMLGDFVYNAGKEVWDSGFIYDGDNGKTYKCKMWFDDGDLSKLQARGFIGVALLGRTETFERVTKAEEEAEAKAAAAKTATAEEKPAGKNE